MPTFAACLRATRTLANAAQQTKHGIDAVLFKPLDEANQ
jgi:hypothetical protein